MATAVGQLIEILLSVKWLSKTVDSSAKLQQPHTVAAQGMQPDAARSPPPPPPPPHCHCFCLDSHYQVTKRAKSVSFRCYIKRYNNRHAVPIINIPESDPRRNWYWRQFRVQAGIKLNTIELYSHVTRFNGLISSKKRLFHSIAIISSAPPKWQAVYFKGYLTVWTPWRMAGQIGV
jgi:hypothetical protein